MKFLCLDYGAKRIGVAVSNNEGTIAFPRTTLKNDAASLDALNDIIGHEQAEAIVMGDTRTFSGGANVVTNEAEAFADKLITKTGLHVVWAREAGSSVLASAGAPEAGHDDAAAAAFILQRYLDMKGGSVQ